MILTPDQRLRVFISSTLGELAEEREAVRRAVESLRLTPVMFEFGARPHPPRSLYRAYLEQSHVFVAIYWQRYGWVAPGAEVSGLEDEYGLSEYLPRLVYIKEPAPQREPELVRLIERIENEGVSSYTAFTSPSELKEIVSNDLVTLLSERFAAAAERRGAGQRAALPASPTPTIGRREEVDSLVGLLTHGGIRMTTLTGPGGVGKTRLAVDAASRLADRFADGVFFIPLATVEDPVVVPQAVLRTLGLSMAGAEDETAAVRDFLRDRRALLVLDNFEQLTGAASMVAGLLSGCPELSILVTSRAALRVRGEHEFVVEPLGIPEDGNSERVSQYDAVRLFIERAKAVRADFRIDEGNAPAVAEICHRLDGLPLAIELAAARIKLLPPEQLLARLDDRLELLSGGRRDAPERHQALRNTILWSYELLSSEEKEFFARLGVFAGRFTLEAAEAVCASTNRLDVVDGLSSLIDKSLVRADASGPQPGFGMLRTIRGFALETLETSPVAAEVQSAHADFFVRRALDAHDGLRGPAEAAWEEELKADADNLSGALDWWLDHRDADTLADVGWSLWMFWWLSGSHHREGRRFMDRVLARELSPRGASRALATRGMIEFWQADYGRAVPDLAAAVERGRKCGDEEGLAYCSAALGLVEMLSTGKTSAAVQIQEARRQLESMGDQWGAALVTNGLYWGLQTAGDLPESDKEYRAALDDAEALGAPQQIEMANANLGRYHLYRGEPAQATAYLHAWLEGIVRMRHKGALASAFEAIAEAALLLADPTRAVHLLAAASVLREAIGAPQRATAVERTARNRRRLEAELGEEPFRRTWSQGTAMGLDDAIAEARGLGIQQQELQAQR